MNRLKIFAGGANSSLAESICRNLSQKPGEIYLHQFPSGEHYCRYMDNIRGGDVFLIQPLSTPVNENTMQLLIMADAARRASAERITAVIPYLGYSRQERKDKSRAPISAKLVLDLISAAGINRVIAMDLHAPQIQGFTNLPFDHLYFAPKLIERLTLGCSLESLNDYVVVAPDVGAVKRAESYSEALGCDLAIITKKRKGDTKVEHTSFVGDVSGKRVLMVDDLTESCGTLIGAAKLCKEKGASHVTCAVTHACLTQTGVDRLADAIQQKVIDKFFHSDTVSYYWHLKFKPPEVEQISVSGVFSRAIRCIHENESISELFE